MILFINLWNMFENGLFITKWFPDCGDAGQMRWLIEVTSSQIPTYIIPNRYLQWVHNRLSLFAPSSDSQSQHHHQIHRWVFYVVKFKYYFMVFMLACFYVCSVDMCVPFMLLMFRDVFELIRLLCVSLQPNISFHPSPLGQTHTYTYHSMLFRLHQALEA